MSIENIQFLQSAHILLMAHLSKSRVFDLVLKYKFFISTSVNTTETELFKKLKNHVPPTEYDIRHLCSLAIRTLFRESNVVDVEAPVNICGDIHGQYADLFNIFNIHGTPETSKYIFLGDYVDRGLQSFETYMTLLSYKVLFPHNIFLIRGNHESFGCTRNFGFKAELEKKFPRNFEYIHSIIAETYRFLLVGVIVNGRVFCVHGGISPDFQTIQEIQLINRFSKITDKRFLDIMWSDPYEEKEFKKKPRGAGYLFGSDQLTHFLAVNNLNYLVRSHQFVHEGFKFDFKNKNCVTVWSAPNYMYFYENDACVLKYDSNQNKITKSDFYIFSHFHDYNTEKKILEKHVNPDEDLKYMKYHRFE